MNRSRMTLMAISALTCAAATTAAHSAPDCRHAPDRDYTDPNAKTGAAKKAQGQILISAGHSDSGGGTDVFLKMRGPGNKSAKLGTNDVASAMLVGNTGAGTGLRQ